MPVPPGCVLPLWWPIILPLFETVPLFAMFIALELNSNYLYRVGFTEACHVTFLFYILLKYIWVRFFLAWTCPKIPHVRTMCCDHVQAIFLQCLRNAKFFLCALRPLGHMWPVSKIGIWSACALFLFTNQWLVLVIWRPVSRSIPCSHCPWGVEFCWDFVLFSIKICYFARIRVELAWRGFLPCMLKK